MCKTGHFIEKGADGMMSSNDVVVPDKTEPFTPKGLSQDLNARENVVEKIYRLF